MRRRTFLGCGAATLACWRPASPPEARGEVGTLVGPRSRLVDETGGALRAADLVAHRSYLFHYPFTGTPCFLLDLGRSIDGGRTSRGGYAWAGGVGRSRSVVAFAAVCPHALTHPTREVSMIHYGGPGTRGTLAQRPGVVTCCVHGSTFDPGRGGEPLQPPAEWPLPAIVLDWDAGDDGLYAVGVTGRLLFDEFFRSFPKAGREPVGATAPVWELERYARSVLSC